MKITWEKYYKFLKDFDNDTYKHQRMGQAFMNEFKIVKDQKLFYQQQRGATLKHIQENYVEAKK
jgi:hypothetical protein